MPAAVAPVWAAVVAARRRRLVGPGRRVVVARRGRLAAVVVRIVAARARDDGGLPVRGDDAAVAPAVLGRVDGGDGAGHVARHGLRLDGAVRREGGLGGVDSPDGGASAVDGWWRVVCELVICGLGYALVQGCWGERGRLTLRRGKTCHSHDDGGRCLYAVC